VLQCIVTLFKNLYSGVEVPSLNRMSILKVLYLGPALSGLRGPMFLLNSQDPLVTATCGPTGIPQNRRHPFSEDAVGVKRSVKIG